MNKMIKNALLIQPLLEFEGGIQPTGYYCRGHVPLETFVSELKEGHEIEANTEHVSHDYYRCVPAGKGMYRWVEAKPGRGAFRVTIWDVP